MKTSEVTPHVESAGTPPAVATEQAPPFTDRDKDLAAILETLRKLPGERVRFIREQFTGMDSGPAEEVPGPRCTPDKAKNEMQLVVGWLIRRTYREKLAAILMNELLQHEDSIQGGGQYEGAVGNEIIRDWEADVIRTFEDIGHVEEEIEGADEMTTEEVALTGFVAGLIRIPE